MDNPEVTISKDALEAVRYILYSPAWADFFHPMLTSMRDSWVRTLLDPSKGRKDATPDDYVKGCIATLDAILSLPKELVDEADDIEAREERNASVARGYDRRAVLGRIGPMLNPDSLPTRD